MKMQFTITISGGKEELADALAILNAVMGEQVDGGSVTAEVSQKQAEKPAAKTDKGEKKSEKIVEIITPEALRAKAAEVAKAGKRDEVKALLDEFKAKNVTSVAEDKRAEFMERLEEL